MTAPFLPPELLQLLQQPNVLSAASAPPSSFSMPAVATPPIAAPAKAPSLWDRINGFLGNAGNAVSGAVGAATPVPEGLAGMISPEEIAAARQQAMLRMGTSLLQGRGHSFGANLGESIERGQQGFNEAIEGASRARLLSEDRATKQEERARAKKLETDRAAIIQKHPPKPNETPQEAAVRMNAMLDDLIAIGDERSVASLSGYLSANNALLSPRQQDDDVVVTETGDGPGAEIVYFSRKTGKEIRREPKKGKPAGAMSEAQQNAEYQRAFARENMLSDDFFKAVAKPQEAARYYATGIGQVDRARAHDPQAQHALVFSMMHVLEPGSVVMPGEYAAAAKLRGLPETVVGALRKLDSGSIMEPEQVDRIVQVMKTAAQSRKAEAAGEIDRFSRRAASWKINPTFIYDPFEGMELGAPGSAAAPSAGARAGSKLGKYDVRK